MPHSTCIRSAFVVLVMAAGPVHAFAQADAGLPAPQPAACRPDDDRMEVLLLGSYHMANPGLDAFNLEADDVLAPRRQAEIEALVERLAGFEPTHVAIETPFGDTAAPARYRAYAAGERELRRNESEQIGFRLAAMLGHETVYPIDVRMDMDDSALGPIIAESPEHQERMGELQEYGRQAIAMMGEWLSEGTVGEMLYEMNRPEFLHAAHELYLRFFVPVVDGDDRAGADMVATWYQRNIRIFSNLHQITDGGDDRVLVVYGQGHIPILNDLVEDSPYFCTVDPLSYLR